MERIAIKIGANQTAVHNYIKKVLLYHTMDRDKLYILVDSTLQELIRLELINVNEMLVLKVILLG